MSDIDLMKKRLERALLISGMNQTELGKIVGVSQQAVQKWISPVGEGGTVPRLSKFKKIAEALKVSESWLLTGIDSDIENMTREELIMHITNRLPELDVRQLTEIKQKLSST